MRAPRFLITLLTDWNSPAHCWLKQIGWLVDKEHYQLLMIGLEGGELSSDEESLLEKFCPGGVILFNRNISSPEQTAELCRQIYRHCERTPIIAIDQEGGLVSRLRAILSVSLSPPELAEHGDAKQIRSYGELTGRMLSLLGINMNLAPVVDIDAGESNNGLRGRHWGASGRTVTERAGAFLSGLEAGGVSGCLKHFPGLGRSSVDSHNELPVIPAKKEIMWEEDLIPFISLAARIPAVMVAHCRYPGFDGSGGPPASASPAVYRIMRRKIGFDGIAVADDIEMGALEIFPAFIDRMSAALSAGADLLPICNKPKNIYESFDNLERIYADGLVPKERLEEACGRVLQVKKTFLSEWRPSRDIPSLFARLDKRLALLRRDLDIDEGKI